MFDNDKFTKMNCIDLSMIVINSMKERNKAVRPEIHFQQMDCTKMGYPDKFFDLIIDKATMDTLLTQEKPYLTVARYLKEVQRCLRIGGKFFLVSTGDADKRMRHLKRSHLKFDVECQEITRQTDDCDVIHFLYICTKAAGSDKAAEKWEDEKKLIYEEEGFDSDFDDDFSEKAQNEAQTPQNEEQEDAIAPKDDEPQL